MELALKLPKGKPPFIGILFTEESTGGHLHANLVEKYSGNEFHIIMEHTKNALNLRLICNEIVMVYFYNHLRFDPDRLKSWLYLTKNAKEFNFGHIYTQFDKHILIMSRPGRKKFVVRATRCKLIAMDDHEEYWKLPYTTSNRKW